MTRFWSLAPLLVPLFVGVGVTGVALVCRGLVLRRLIAAARRRNTESAELLYRSVRLPSLLWSVAAGLYAGIEAASLPGGLAVRLGLVLQTLLIASLTVTSANILAAVIARFGERHTLEVGTTGLAQAVVKGVVLTVGSLILLAGLGVAITPALTALGIGGLAVALALQDTLSNLFAGVYLLVDRAIQVGDLVRLESGVEGSVQDIGWRSTRLRAERGQLVVVPNAKLAQSTITKLTGDSRARERHAA